MTDVRIVLLGNSFASKVQLPALRWAGGNQVVGLAGADATKARKTADEWDIPHATGDWRELMELDPNLVIVSTPVHLHAKMVRAALQTRAAILCEKPFALDAEEAAPLVEAAAGRLALIDHQLRWSPWRRALTAKVQEGFLGQPWSARVSMLFGSAKRLTAPWSWWYDASRGGGTLGAIGSHMLDALQLDLGGVQSVRAELRTHVPVRRDANGLQHEVTADERALCWLRMECGAEVNLEADVTAPGGGGSLVEYVGSEGSLRLVGETTLLAARHGEEHAAVEVEEPPTCEQLGMPDQGPFARMLPAYLRDILGAVSRGESTLPRAATFADGLATVRIMDAARRSAARASWESCTP